MATCETAVISAVVLAAASPSPMRAQDSEPVFDQLVAAFQRDYLALGILIQVVGDFQSQRPLESRNGFSIANARLRLSGNLDGGFGYLLQSNLAALAVSPILDAAVHYRVGEGATIRGGLFKAPFSREFLTPAASIDFVNRSLVVTALAPNRQVGVQLAGRPGRGLVGYAVGAFNGNRLRPGGNDNNALLYVARLGVWPRVATASRPDDALEVAVNGAHSRDSGADLPDIAAAFNGTRTVLGADVRWRRGRWLVAGEMIGARLRFDSGGTRHPWGWHATAGYLVTGKSQVLARWDALRPDSAGLAQDFVVLGYNLWPTRPTELQVNYLIPLNRGGWERHRVLVNLQIGF